MPDENTLNYISSPDSAGDNAYNLGGTVNTSGTVNDTATTYSASKVQTLVNVVTLAEINAGKTLLAGVAGKTITVVGVDAKVSGNFAATTSVDLEDTNGTPVAIATAAVAALTDAAILDSTTANVTMGAGFLGALTAGEGIAVTNTGSAATTGTSITYKVDYVIS